MYPHLSEEEKGDLTELLSKLEKLTDKCINNIQTESKKFLSKK